jgi:hypothetical protein
MLLREACGSWSMTEVAAVPGVPVETLRKTETGRIATPAGEPRTKSAGRARAAAASVRFRHPRWAVLPGEACHPFSPRLQGNHTDLHA